MNLTSRSRNREDITATTGNTVSTLNTPTATEMADASIIPKSNGDCKQEIGRIRIMGNVFWNSRALKMERCYTQSSICDMMDVLTVAYPNSSSRLTLSL